MIEVEVIYCPRPSVLDRTVLALPPGCTLGQALAASGVLQRHGLQAEGLAAGVWGRRQPLDHPLRARDRVEVYRPLQCDPKEARRQRYRRQDGGTGEDAGADTGANTGANTGESAGGSAASNAARSAARRAARRSPPR